ncbi:hypothetical protein [Celeribacter sp.]|uniref:hypothetical protein n=1 Tax=Celeribacter sp. TaxID=1890673 RepID=UPI003A9037DA
MRAFALIPSTLLCTAIAMPVVADVTPEDVWNDTLATIKLFGQSVTADLERDGKTLIARNVEFRSGADEGGLSSVTTMEQLNLVNLGNGTVKMDFVSPIISHASYPTFSEIDGDDILAEMTSNVMVMGDIIVSGDPDAVMYKVDGADFEFLSEVSSADEMALAQTTEMTMSDVSGAWSSTLDGTKLTGQFLFDADSYGLQMNQPGAEGPQAQINLTMKDVSTEGEYEGTEQANPEDWNTALSNLTARFAQSFETGTFETQFADGDSPSATKVAGTIGHTWVDMSTLDGSASYETSSSDIAATISGPAVPVDDAQVFIANMSTNINLPLTGRETAQPFGLGLSFEDIGVSSAIWAMFDPQGQLSQEPATVTLKLSGDALVTEALTPTNPAAITDGGAPQLDRLNLDTLLVSFAGAKVDATGAFKAITGAASPMGGLPDLAGSIDVTMTNVTSLIDTLTRMGIAPPEFGGMAQMMLGMLARPGPEVGTLVSHIERTEDGQILANGMPLPF